MFPHRRVVRLLPQAMLAATLVLYAAPTAGASTVNPPEPTFEQQILDLTNTARTQAGCPMLRLDPALGRAAFDHSADMAGSDFLDHVGSDGRGSIQRILEAGYPNVHIGENLAAGSVSAAETFQLWMDSSAHRSNILDCSYTELGVGHAVNQSTLWKNFWAQTFGNAA